MAKVTTVIFDVFETLAYNDQELWIGTLRGICRDQSLDVDHRLLYREWKSLDMVFRRSRLNMAEPEKSPPFKTYEEAWRDCFRVAFSKLGLKGDASAAARQAVRDMSMREPYQDAVDALPKIQASWRTGILSNSDDAYLFPLLERLGSKFEAVLSSQGARAYKPLPGPFRQIMGRMGVSADEVVYVGDVLFDDVEGAKGVGMRAAWVNRNGVAHDPQYSRPDYVVRSLTELPEILRADS